MRFKTIVNRNKQGQIIMEHFEERKTYLYNGKGQPLAMMTGNDSNKLLSFLGFEVILKDERMLTIDNPRVKKAIREASLWKMIIYSF